MANRGKVPVLTAPRLSQDQRLRKAGFTLADRPPGRSAVWTRGGHEYRQPEAVTLMELEAEARGKV